MMASAINLVSERYSSRRLFYVAVFVVQMIFLSLLQQAKLVVAEPVKFTMIRPGGINYDQNSGVVKLGGRRCEEIYVVREGETLHSISDKCRDPFILEHNPHVQESDDVFPGLVIKISSSTTPSAPPSTPTMPRKFLM